MLLQLLAVNAVLAAANAAGTFCFRTNLANLWFGGTRAGFEVRPLADRWNGNLMPFELYLSSVSEVDAHGVKVQDIDLNTQLASKKIEWDIVMGSSPTRSSAEFRAAIPIQSHSPSCTAKGNLDMIVNMRGIGSQSIKLTDVGKTLFGHEGLPMLVNVANYSIAISFSSRDWPFCATGSSLRLQFTTACTDCNETSAILMSSLSAAQSSLLNVRKTAPPVRFDFNPSANIDGYFQDVPVRVASDHNSSTFAMTYPFYFSELEATAAFTLSLAPELDYVPPPPDEVPEFHRSSAEPLPDYAMILLIVLAGVILAGMLFGGGWFLWRFHSREIEAYRKKQAERAQRTWNFTMDSLSDFGSDVVRLDSVRTPSLPDEVKCDEPDSSESSV